MQSRPVLYMWAVVIAGFKIDYIIQVTNYNILYVQ